MGQAIRVEAEARSTGRALVGRLSRPAGSRPERETGIKSPGDDGRRARTRGPATKARTAEDLDEELEAFMQGRPRDRTQDESKEVDNRSEGMLID